MNELWMFKIFQKYVVFSSCDLNYFSFLLFILNSNPFLFENKKGLILKWIGVKIYLRKYGSSYFSILFFRLKLRTWRNSWNGLKMIWNGLKQIRRNITPFWRIFTQKFILQSMLRRPLLQIKTMLSLVMIPIKLLLQSMERVNHQIN